MLGESRSRSSLVFFSLFCFFVCLRGFVKSGLLRCVRFSFRYHRALRRSSFHSIFALHCLVLSFRPFRS